MGGRLCTPNSPNEPLAAYARANPASLTDPDLGGPPQELIRAYLHDMQTEFSKSI